MINYLKSFIFLLISLSGIAFGQSSYTLNFSNPLTYSITCGSVNPAQWEVRNQLCTLSTPVVSVGGSYGDPYFLINSSVRINSSGNLTASDSAVIRYYSSGFLAHTLTIRGDTVSNAVTSYPYAMEVPPGGTFQITVTFNTVANNQFWQLKNGDISFNITSPLPIGLLDFSAVVENENSVDIKWATVTEIDNNFFTVEKSMDGEAFEVVATLKGAGNSNHVLNYQIIDNNPFPGTSYYRLKQTDFNGNSETFFMVPVDINGFGFSMCVIFPDPNNGIDLNLMVNNLKIGDYLNITISDAYGKEIYQKSYSIINPEKNSFMINPTNALTPGIYFVSGFINNKYYKSRFVVY